MQEITETMIALIGAAIFNGTHGYSRTEFNDDYTPLNGDFMPTHYYSNSAEKTTGWAGISC